MQGEMILSTPFARIPTFMEKAPMAEHDMSELHFMEKAPAAEHDMCQISKQARQCNSSYLNSHRSRERLLKCCVDYKT